MNKQATAAFRREGYTAANSEPAPFAKVTKSESQRMAEWLRKHGEPSLSPWKRRKRK